jgi:hypothetical protein
MSQEEVVVKEANAVNDLIRGKVHYCCNKEIKKLFSHYNNLFQSMESFSEEEYNCVDCRDTVVKFWSFVLFDLWEREII